MAINSIQTVKLNIINRVTSLDDQSMLQKIWELISSNEPSEQSKRVFTKEEKEILNSIKKGLKEVKLIQQGKSKATSAKDFLNEL